MNGFALDYPIDPGFKRGVTRRSNAASRKAAIGLKESGRHASIKEAVLDWFKQGHRGTADECAIALGLSINSVRPRCTELLTQGLLADTGKMRRATGGREAQVWRLA